MIASYSDKNRETALANLPHSLTQIDLFAKVDATTLALDLLPDLTSLSLGEVVNIWIDGNEGGTRIAMPPTLTVLALNKDPTSARLRVTSRKQLP